MSHKDPRRHAKYWPKVLKVPTHAALFRADCLEKPRHHEIPEALPPIGLFVRKPLSPTNQLCKYAHQYGLTVFYCVSTIGPNFFSFEGTGRGEMQYMPEMKECAIQQKGKRGVRWDSYRVKNAYGAVHLFVKLKPMGGRNGGRKPRHAPQGTRGLAPRHGAS